VIEIEDVDVTFGELSVLESVSLSVADGEFLAVVGPNGAGKTTLLQAINGLVTPRAGRVRVDGCEVATCSARERGRLVATVPQETSIAFSFDVSAFVAMGRTPHRSRFEMADTDDRAAVEAALERTDTARFGDRSVDELSGGQRQRVVLARALAQATPALLLDEPTANLDINHQIRTLALARSLADEGKTVVAAIHDLDLAARFCDRMAMLADGSILAEGSPETVLASERLETAFEVRTAVATNPVTGTPTVTPLSDDPPGETRVHVLGRGTAAARVIGRLVEAGITVTAGVLPAGDVAALTAAEIAREVVTAPAFEPIADDRRQATEALLREADATVVAGAIDETTDRLASVADAVLVLDGVDCSVTGETVSEAELLERIDSDEPIESMRSSTR
jgi:iron complex transport system ATP-binding protein